MVMTKSQFVRDRVGSLSPSPTLAVAKQAQALRRSGVDVVDFGPGEPDFDTRLHIREAATKALQDGFTHYTPSRGMPELLAAIADTLEQVSGLTYDPATEIVVTPGAKQALAGGHIDGRRERGRGHTPRSELGVVRRDGAAGGRDAGPCRSQE